MNRWTTGLAAAGLVALLGACGPREDAADRDVEETSGEEEIADVDEAAGGHEPYGDEAAPAEEGAMPTLGEGGDEGVE